MFLLCEYKVFRCFVYGFIIAKPANFFYMVLTETRSHFKIAHWLTWLYTSDFVVPVLCFWIHYIKSSQTFQYGFDRNKKSFRDSLSDNFVVPVLCLWSHYIKTSQTFQHGFDSNSGYLNSESTSTSKSSR